MPSPIQARALIQTRGRGGGFSARNVARVKNFYVDSAIDTDADSWNLTIGDPEAELIEILERDNEVRVNIIAIGENQLTALAGGFADEIFIDQEGTLSLNGRDLSAVPADSQHPPERWRQTKVDSIISKEARALGIGDRLKIAAMNSFKIIHTDGSESYWEFWYRLARKRQNWMWVEPDGTIHCGKLAYDKAPIYKIGHPAGGFGEQGWISVERAEWRKSTTTRIGEAFIFGHRGDVGFVGRAKDPDVSHWIKKPIKIIEDSSLYNQKQAEVEAREEIFESKVGAVEWRMVVADPGFVIQQNNMAIVSLPEIGLAGQLYVVGARTVLADDGLYQEVRLREKGFAVSKRVPKDPPDGKAPTEGRSKGTGRFLNFRWGAFFAEAALKWHGVWNYYLFLACLLAMCGERETGFRNVREGGNTEWYPPPSVVTDPDGAEKHRELFENDPGNTSFGRDAGVGPMQLTTHSLKEEADRHYGLEDELVGGRWHPRSNIWVAAHYLNTVLKPWEKNPSDENIWNGVRAYNGSGPRAEEYMQEVKKAVGKVGEGGYLDEVMAAQQALEDEEDDNPPPQDRLKRIPSEYTQGGTVRYCHESVWAAAIRVARKSGAEISSAFRTVEQNRAANGDPNSDHLCGYAIDYVPPSDAARRAAEEESPYQILVHDAGSGLHLHVGFKKCPAGDHGSPGSPVSGTEKVIVVQAGHAAPREPGFEGQTGTTDEISFTTQLRNEVVSLLDKDSRFKAISVPGDIPDGVTCDAALYLHGDGSTNTSLRGTSFGYQTGAGNSLANMIRNRYADIPGHPPAHQDNYTSDLSGYYGFSRTNSGGGPEVVVESGFLTNSTEHDWLFNHIEEMARAIYNALLDYFNLGST